MSPPPIASRRRALAVCAHTVLTVLVCGGLLTAAVLVPAPVVVLPLIAGVCLGLPMLAAWQLACEHIALGGLLAAVRRRGSLDRRALRELHRALQRLPETAHPLDR